jgi:hypothetical protein
MPVSHFSNGSCIAGIVLMDGLQLKCSQALVLIFVTVFAADEVHNT